MPSRILRKEPDGVTANEKVVIRYIMTRTKSAN
jgi:hypothetical protein